MAARSTQEGLPPSSGPRRAASSSPGAEGARDVLARELGADVVPLYRTVELRPERFPEADLVVLASASAARSFAALGLDFPAFRSGRSRPPRRAASGSASSPRPRPTTGTGSSRAVKLAASQRRFITLLTDFGLEDDFVGTCKGVIKRIAPDAEVIDITHGIAPQHVLQGALVLANTLPYMPEGVHMAVVDPGVGGERKALALQGGDGRLFVGPDNGLLLARRRAARRRRGGRRAHRTTSSC